MIPGKATVLACMCVLPVLFLEACAPRYVREGGGFLGDGDRRRVVRIAHEYIGVPYRNGGTSPSGFDCSGYVMYVFRRSGLALPRRTEDQFWTGQRVRARGLRLGDLVFFNIRGRGISHVGIYAGRGKFLHAPRSGKRVSYASLKNPYWRKHYAGAVTHFSPVYSGMYERRRSSAGIRSHSSGSTVRGCASP